MHPDRIVLGVQSKKAENVLREVYKPLKAHLIVTDMNSAELIKHASNSFLATKISFINAVSQICDHVGGDVLKVAEGMGYDKRIGKEFLSAGVGYGGSCFPKDVDAFIRLSENCGYDFALLKEVRKVNDFQKKEFLKVIESALWNIKGKTIGVWGLSFKPNTDDMRSAPSVDIIKELQREGAKIKVYDPQAMAKAKEVLKSIKFCKDPYEAAKGTDCLLLLTEWEDFRALNLTRVKYLMNHALLFDGRNFFCKREVEQLGFEYFGVGTKGHK
jgi:UDPglucose 6-dehydrogenase